MLFLGALDAELILLEGDLMQSECQYRPEALGLALSKIFCGWV